MKRYFLYTLQVAPLLWFVVSIAVIATSILYAFLSVAGIPDNISFFIALLILIGLIAFGLLFAPLSLFFLRREKVSLPNTSTSDNSSLVEQFTQSIEKLEQGATQGQVQLVQLQTQVLEQFTRSLEQLIANTAQSQKNTLPAQAQPQPIEHISENFERLTQLLTKQQQQFEEKLDQLSAQQQLIQQKLDQLGEQQQQETHLQEAEADITDTSLSLDRNIAREADRAGRTSTNGTQAEKEQQRILAEDEAKLGPKHPKVAGDLDKLAAIYVMQDQLEQAEQLYRRALAIREQKFGPDHPETAQSLDNLASFYVLQNQFEAAEQFYRRALTIREQKFGPDHFSLIETLKNYADLLRQMKREKEARQLEKRANLIQGNSTQQTERKGEES